ncbi:MAG: hypothetical protein AAB546_03445 [Patescibacteria group bacterium]
MLPCELSIEQIINSEDFVFIADGVDSSVYRYQDKAIKIYDNGGFVLSFYTEIINKSSLYLNNNPKFFTLPSGDRIPITINPIDCVREENGNFSTISPFVEGLNLIDLLNGEDCEDVFGMELLELKFRIMGIIRTIGKDLQKNFDLSEFNILAMNVKLTPNSIVITDFGLSIEDIKPI